jgi:amino acid adenylation domain-containing protein
MTLTQVFEDAVKKFPSHLAIKGEGFSYTYTAFETATRQFAGQLIAQGILPGENVGICLDRSAGMLVGIFGILRAGAAYLPIDASHPRQRVLTIIADAGVKNVVTTQNLSDYVLSMGCRPIVPFSEAYNNQSLFQLPAVNPTDTAYTLFTSGSTGIPKGVVIAHRSVVNLVQYIQNEYPIGEGDVVLFKSPYTFDSSVWELFGWMLMGGTLYVAPQGDEKDPKRLWQIIDKEKVAILFFVPSMLNALLEYYPFYAKNTADFALQWVSAGGEVVPVSLVKKFYEIFDFEKVKLANVYGPTETTVYATTFLCRPEAGYAKVPIGYPVTNDFIHIIGENGRMVDDGQEGEIYIGGAGVAKGYLNNEILTREKFVPDIFTHTGMLYRTGDIGRKSPEGYFEFVGRKDNQVKLRGLRIELGEIEFALQQVPEIDGSLAVISKDFYQNDCIVGFIRLAGPHTVYEVLHYQMADEALVHAIKSKISEWLPDYMIPTFFVTCNNFPRNAHDKTDRSVLPRLTDILENDQVSDFVPKTITGQKIVELWKQSLGLTAIGHHDDFFSLGGHSLKAVHLISLIMRDLQVEVPLSEFYSGITPKTMTEAIENGIYPVAAVVNSKKQTDNEHRGLPLTAAQTELWVLNNLDPTGISHNIQIEFLLTGQPDIEKFSETVKTIIREEEIFNSVFIAEREVPQQFVRGLVDVHLPYTDFSVFKEDRKQIIYDELCLANGNTLFTVEQLPLFALHLVKWSENLHKLLLAVHHIVFDGWSLHLFMKRMLAHYTGEFTPIPDWRNIDYVNYLDSPGKRIIIADELGFWAKTLDKLPKRWSLPTIQKEGYKIELYAGERYWWKLEPQLAAESDSFAANNHTTPFSLFMSAFQLCLASCGSDSDIVVGTPFANRNHEIVNHLIGYYTNMVSIRLKWDSKTTLNELVARCSKNAVGAFSNATVSFGEIARLMGRQSAETGYNEIYHALFVMQNWPHENFIFPGFTLEQREIGNHSSKTEITLNIEKTGNEYTCWFEYIPGLYKKETIEKFSEAFSYAVNTIITSPGLPAKQLTDELRKIILFNHQPSCYVVGSGKLAARCIEILQNKSFEISRVITSDSWLCREVQVQCSGPEVLENAAEVLLPVDYIFSINNSYILNPGFLALAQKMSVNYHDAPLPKYAGMFATNWAILDDSKIHGISWHEITETIDAGDLLETVAVPVLPDDTALSLNTRCFEAAILGFDRLTNNITNDSLTGVKQNLSERTYFPLAKRPEFFGSFYTAMSAMEADCLIRATNFGENVDNEFAIPWLWVGNDLYIVAEAVVIKDECKEPGFFGVVNKQAGFYCSDGFIAFITIFDSGLIEREAIKIFSENSRMMCPNPEESHCAANYFKKIARFEPFWKETLEKANYVTWPFVGTASFDLQSELELNAETIAKMTALFPENSAEDVLIAMAALLLLRLSDRYSGTFALGCDIRETECHHYFNPWVPLTLEAGKETKASETLLKMLAVIKQIEKAGTFVRSLPLRYPGLRENGGIQPEIVFHKNGISNFVSNKINILVSSLKIKVFVGNEFSPAGITTFVKCFKSFFNSFLNNPEISFTHQPLMDVTLAEKTIQTINPLQSGNPVVYRDVISLFLEMVKEQPDATAVFDDGMTISYSGFLSDVLELKNELSDRGITTESIVAVTAERSYTYMVSVMAVLFSGACFLPLDTGLPASRLSFILQDAHVSLVLTGKQNAEVSLPVPVFSVTGKQKSTGVSLPELLHYQPESKAYIIYTSGSTGLPKAVAITRKNLSGFVAGAISVYGMNPADKVLQFSNLSFDASIEEIFCTFCCGGTLYLRTENLIQPEELVQFSRKHSLTVWDLPTAFWRQLLHTEEYKTQVENLSLRLVIIGGEAVNPVDIAHWTSQNPKHQLINSYGPTETTVVALTCKINKSEPYKTAVPIGRPLPGYKTFITGREAQLLPLGVPGELMVAGIGVSPGYLNRREEGEEVFTNLKLPDGTIESVYCTGDKVYADESGLVYYIGRNDNQLKIRGFRIEPAEIEQQLMSLGNIESCLVLPLEKKGEIQLVAFYTTPGKKSPGVGLRESLKEKLPVYMMPKEFFFVENMPLTSNGKADTKALLALAKSKKNNTVDETEKPLNDTEVYLAEMWKKILGIDSLGFNDDFFELGGHSLKAVGLIAELKKQKEITVPLASLMQNPTVRKFAGYIDHHKIQTQWSCLVAIRPEGNLSPIYLIHGAGLNILLYQSLIKNLNPNRPIFAFQAAGLDGSIPIRNSIEEMAQDYIRELLKANPAGPYCLLGFSLGGFVAFEMSRILSEKGHPVAFTGLIDSVAHLADFSNNSLKKIRIRTTTGVAKPFYNIWLFVKEPYFSKQKFLSNKVKNIRLTLLNFFTKTGLIHKRNLQNDIGDMSFQSDQILIHLNNALRKYKLKEANFEVDLFAAGKSTFFIYDRKMYGWSSFAKKGFRKHIIPGEHSQLFVYPNDKIFAGILEERLTEVDENWQIK